MPATLETFKEVFSLFSQQPALGFKLMSCWLLRGSIGPKRRIQRRGKAAAAWATDSALFLRRPRVPCSGTVSATNVSLSSLG